MARGLHPDLSGTGRSLVRSTRSSRDASRFWQMLGHNQGQMLNAAQLAAGLRISGQTVGRYLDIMVDLLLVRRLQPWASNVGKRLALPEGLCAG
jgi:predicted AAA+ superfamily ATPase